MYVCDFCGKNIHSGKLNKSSAKSMREIIYRGIDPVTLDVIGYASKVAEAGDKSPKGFREFWTMKARNKSDDWLLCRSCTDKLIEKCGTQWMIIAKKEKKEVALTMVAAFFFLLSFISFVLSFFVSGPVFLVFAVVLFVIGTVLGVWQYLRNKSMEKL